jgi:hypothetical protein
MYRDQKTKRGESMNVKLLFEPVDRFLTVCRIITSTIIVVVYIKMVKIKNAISSKDRTKTIFSFYFL